MNRFEQRLKQHLRDPRFANGYREMSAEIATKLAQESVLRKDRRKRDKMKEQPDHSKRK